MSNIWIGTNFKMHKTIRESVNYTHELKEVINDLPNNFKIFIIPSFISLNPVKEIIDNTSLLLGAQNMHWKNEGAYTGEISPPMLKEVGIDLVELGHSERRAYYNETDIEVNRKVLAALQFKMKPLICIGENKKDKEQNFSRKKLKKQIHTCLKNVSKYYAKDILIAYEPVWAIGEQGTHAEYNYVESNMSYIRSLLIEMYGYKGKDITLLFGGSVNKENAEEYLQIANVNGLFIGRSAWDIDNFSRILKKMKELF